MSMFRTYTDFERTPNKNNQIQATSYSCDICEEGDWMSETEVDIHKKTDHLQQIGNIIKNRRKFACMICAKVHVDKESLYHHVKTVHLLSSVNAKHIEREIFICDHCCHIFFNKLLLEIHIVRKHRKLVSKNWEGKCPKCSKILRKTCLWSHLENHQMSSVSTCPICLEKCANRTDLYNHTQKHRRYYFCGVCEFSTMIADNYNKHMQCHRRRFISADSKWQKFFVPKSKIKSVPNFSVQSVMKGLLLLNNVQICIICRYICVNVTEMQNHWMFDHTTLDEVKKKVYMCACSEVFFNKILLTQHIFKEKDGHRVLEEVEVDTADTEPEQDSKLDSESDSDSDPLVRVKTMGPDDL